MSTMKLKRQGKVPLVYKPVGFALSWGGGALAGIAFQKAWKVLRNEDNAPDALDRDRGWAEILLAAAAQGAIFAVVRSVVDRSGAEVVHRATGVWPSGEKTGRD
ncbi:DUF4235 domain-containing protein [Streptomyces sp. NPDC006678]|uniref:DUF4235 domain-containing protein n=1 Tax=Streptomyces sp. NPDC006678 TaxID=3157185 RepID=UPI0033E36A62